MDCPVCKSKVKGLAVICNRCGASLAAGPLWKKKKRRRPTNMILFIYAVSVTKGISRSLFHTIGVLLSVLILLGSILILWLLLELINPEKWAKRRNAARLRYVSMSDSEREADIAEKLRSYRKPEEPGSISSADMTAEAAVIARLFKDTLFGELTDDEKQLLAGSKAARTFLHKYEINILAQRMYDPDDPETDEAFL